MKPVSRNCSVVLATLLIPLASCTTRSRIDDVVRDFFGEINKSNFETAKSKYLSAALIDEQRALPLVGRQHKTIQESFQQAAGSIESVELSGEAVKGEDATVTASLTTSWGTKESGTIELVKEEGKIWKIRNWGEFRALGSAHALNANNLCAVRNLGAAVAEYQAALAENPHDSAIVTAMGICYQSMGKTDEAAAQYRRAIEMHPNGVWDPYINLGSIYASRGDTTRAEEQFKGAIKNRPDSAGCYNALAWMYADKGIKLDKAVELSQKALQLTPDDPNIMDTLGWAYYRKGMRTEAIRYLAEATAKAPANVTIRSHYGEVSTTAAVHLARARQLMNAGHFDQAAAECDAALRQGPNDDQAKNMRGIVGKEAAAQYVNAARAALEKQQYDPALSQCDLALRYDPQNADAASLKTKIADVKKVLGYQ